MAQIATITVETAGGPVDLPVYEPGDSGSGRLEAFRVQTASGPGFVPLAAVDEADRPYLRVQTSSGVRAVDTSASGIPDSDVYLPMDEGSGTELNDANNNADATLASDSWESDTNFKGDTAPKDTTATLTPPTGSSLTVVQRIEANANMGGTAGNNVFDFSNDPLISWNDNLPAWRLSDVSQSGRCEVTESATDLNGNVRIVAGRYSSSESKLDVYDNSLNLIGSDSAADGDVTFETSTMDLAFGNWDNFDQLFYKLDYLTDSELSDLLNNYYA